MVKKREGSGKVVFEFGGVLVEQDPNNWIVKTPVGGKKKGGQSYDIGYYGNLKAALSGLFESLVKKRLSTEVSHSVDMLAQKIDRVKEELLHGISSTLKRDITIQK